MRYLRSTKGFVAVAVLGVLVALAAAGCGGSSSSATARTGVAGARHVAGSATVKTRTIKGLGAVLVDARGRTLYVFAPDKHRRVTCTGSCATFWPPLKLKGAQKPVAGGAARASLLGSDRNPAGGRVATYAKWPLYTYVGDSRAGTASGEAVNANGGLWYVISPAGKVVKAKGSAGGSTTSGGGGGGWG
jgi:predicted lipoprotein with Yx(FWY)xxD motif